MTGFNALIRKMATTLFAASAIALTSWTPQAKADVIATSSAPSLPTSTGKNFLPSFVDSNWGSFANNPETTITILDQNSWQCISPTGGGCTLAAKLDNIQSPSLITLSYYLDVEAGTTAPGVIWDYGSQLTSGSGAAATFVGTNCNAPGAAVEGGIGAGAPELSNTNGGRLHVTLFSVFAGTSGCGETVVYLALESKGGGPFNATMSDVVIGVQSYDQSLNAVSVSAFSTSDTNPLPANNTTPEPSSGKTTGVILSLAIGAGWCLRKLRLVDATRPEATAFLASKNFHKLVA